MTRPQVRVSLDVTVREYIIHHILEEGLKPGDPLPTEAQLAETLGMGRSSIREAVKKLQSLGIVEVRHGTGLFVRESNFDPLREMVGYVIRFSPSALKEIGEVRFLLESAAIEEVVPRFSATDIRDLEASLEAWKSVDEKDQTNDKFDKEFHRILYGPLRNNMLLMLLEEFWAAFEQLDDPLLHEAQPVEEVIFHHQAILEAVKAQDPVLARQRLMKHFEHLQACLAHVRGESQHQSLSPVKGNAPV